MRGDGESLALDLADSPGRKCCNADYDPEKDQRSAIADAGVALLGARSEADGDFRRRITLDGELLRTQLKTVMTRNPICIRDDALVAEALKIFNERNIDDLIVVNAKKEPVGLVDSQDLPKLKLM